MNPPARQYMLRRRVRLIVPVNWEGRRPRRPLHDKNPATWKSPLPVVTLNFSFPTRIILAVFPPIITMPPMTSERVIRHTQHLTRTAAVGALFILAAVCESRAEDPWTNIVNGTTLNLVGPYMVGTNSAFNWLQITNGGIVLGTGTNYIGNSSIANSNSVWVTGLGSVWSNSSRLYVGNTGSFNQLTIAASATVFSTTGYVGFSSSSSNNAVLVTGTNSVWSNSGDLNLGLNGSSNSLTIANGGTVFNTGGYIGLNSTASNNTVLVTGDGSVWSNSSYLYVGFSGSTNSLTITNSGTVFNTASYIGFGITSSNNTVLVTGAGSVWSNSIGLLVGYSGSGNSLTITNGGTVFSSSGYIGYNASASNNTVLVTGVGSLWSNSNRLCVGNTGSFNQLTIANSGTVVATNILIGTNTSTGNRITVSGGNLYATNNTGTGALDVRNGTLALNTGTVAADRFLATNNASSVMTFSAGLLRSGGSSVSNGVAFTVGDGTSAATLDLVGGTHSFADGLVLTTNSSLIGIGSIIAGSATNFGTIAPGHSAGTLSFSGDLTLRDSSVLNMELGGTNSGAYDQVFVGGILRIGGLLNVTLTNGYTGSIGDTFDLFNFSSETGTFSQTNLPTLSPGMEWNTSKLYTLGDIQIVPEPGVSALLALGLAALASRRVKSEKLRVKS